MKQFKRGVSYLVRVRNGAKSWTSVYQCKICLKEREFYNSSVKSGHTKTCGCRNGQNIEISINSDGTILSAGGYDLTSKIANGYRGYNKEYLHRIIATKFIPNPMNYSDINHINGNKQDNRVENLEWCTRSHNLQHAIDTGLKKYRQGIPSKTRKLSKVDIDYILSSTYSGAHLGVMFNVSKTVIYNIKNRKTYLNFSEQQK